MYVLEIEFENGSIVEYQLAYLSHYRRYKNEINASKKAVLWGKIGSRLTAIEVLK